MRRYSRALISPLFVALLCSCDKSHPSAEHANDTSHAHRVEVTHPQPETELTTVHLSEAARSHLDIQTVPIRRAAIQNVRTYGGEIVIPEGRSIIISAPLTGTIATTSSTGFPRPGVVITTGEALFDLIPSLRSEDEVLNPSDRIALARARADLEAARVQAAGEVDAAEVRLQATRIALDRAGKLVAENAGSRRALDEARRDHQLAETSQAAAHARQEVLDETLAYLKGDGGGAKLTIAAPFGGVVRRLWVAPNEVIAGNAPLCEIADLDPLWVRVAIYVGDMNRLSINAPASAQLLGDKPEDAIVLRPVDAPPTANPATSTVDVYYEIDNSASAFQVGSRVVVAIPSAGEAAHLLVARHAILYDIHGDGWVYVAKSDRVFQRKRVTVKRVVGDEAAVVGAVTEGEQAVTQGATELFGVEFGSAGH